MTLQQKMLAKQSKKGFTLVELVVVIAILAILAAIAIPAVVGIINNANDSQSKTDAADIDSACKNFYAAVVSGSLNQSSDDSSKITNASSVLPLATASASDRKSKAQAATVKSALEWNGIWTQVQNKIGTNGDFVYDKDGNIFAKTDASRSSGGITGTVQASTVLGTNSSKAADTSHLGYK